MRSIILVFILVITVVGCSSTVPINNVDFVAIDSIKKLEGIYKNLGESGDPDRKYYLSKIIWPKDNEIQHESIETIEVRLVGKRSFFVKGLHGSEVIKTSTFREGEDFEITKYGINIKNELIPSLAYPAGNPFIGLAYESVTLGIDVKGDGKYRDKTSLAGLAYLIPIAGSSLNDVRFKKIAN